MANTEKQTLQLLCTYIKLLHGHLTESGHRLAILETAVKSKPELIPAYDLAFQNVKSPYLPGLDRQFQAIQQAVEKLPD